MSLKQLKQQFELDMEQIEECRRDMVAKAEERWAKNFLRVYRGMLAEHDTHRHVITISAAMGTFVLCIDGKIWYPDDCMGRKLRFSIGQTLNEIYKKAEYAWMWKLDGERLN